MKRYLTVLALWVALLSCDKQSIDPASCQVNDPLTELDWLRAIIADEPTPYLQIE